MSDSSRDRRTEARHAAASLDAEACPALAAFAGGYLHEDLALDYGSAAEAAWAFCHDVELDEVAALAREWELLESIARHLPIPEVAELLAARFGAAWQPVSFAEISAVTAELHAVLADPLDAD
ncbi:MAG: hypothetical protein IPJ17_11695 [Holophagales bacterium]|nr:MAG: hypothetical protein IPJ17_11695 [Holophagales bacterium]